MGRPTLDDLQREQSEFIGPMEPIQPPKMQGSGNSVSVTPDEIRKQFPNIFQKS